MALVEGAGLLVAWPGRKSRCRARRAQASRAALAGRGRTNAGALAGITADTDCRQAAPWAHALRRAGWCARRFPDIQMPVLSVDSYSGPWSRSLIGVAHEVLCILHARLTNSSSHTIRYTFKYLLQNNNILPLPGKVKR